MPSYRRTCLRCAAVALLLAMPTFAAEPSHPTDWRAFEAGREIYSSGYIDQPYVVVLADGTWLCLFTTGAGKEGQGGQHVVATRSSDEGRSWSEPVDVEPAVGPAASWIMPYLTKYGRVYVFYDYNGDRVETLRGRKVRNDMLGWYCYKHSDDGGLTWSKRYRLPLRVTACDRGNDWRGEVQIFWGIDKADHVGPGMMFGFTKLGKYMLDLGEGWFFRCDNINAEKDPDKLQWQVLPEGDHGLRHPDFGSVQEEHNLVPLSDGSLYCIYRTCLGYPAESYSRDGGMKWTKPRLVRYADGTLLKNPRACPRLFRTSNGKFLLWFHNHSGTDYTDRNPAWLTGGIERDGRMLWSQPEILIYGHDTSRATGRFSYPDLIEHDGRYWTTCTNKETGRVHEVPSDLLEGLWAQFDEAPSAMRVPEPVAAYDVGESAAPTVRAASLSIDTTVDAGGFTIDMVVEPDGLEPGRTLLDGMDKAGRGVSIVIADDGQMEITLSNGSKDSRWSTDPGILTTSKRHRVTVIVDNGPKIISWVVDGRLCDGGEGRQFGWARYDRSLGRIAATPSAEVNAQALAHVRLFDRPLRTSEAIAMQKRPLPPADAQ